MVIPVANLPTTGALSDDEGVSGIDGESVSSAPSAPVTSPPNTPGGPRVGSAGQASNHSSKQDDNRKRTKSESTAQDEVRINQNGRLLSVHFPLVFSVMKVFCFVFCANTIVVLFVDSEK